VAWLAPALVTLSILGCTAGADLLFWLWHNPWRDAEDNWQAGRQAGRAHTHAHIVRWLCGCVFVCGVQSRESLPGTRQRLAARRASFALMRIEYHFASAGKAPSCQGKIRSAVCRAVCICVCSPQQRMPCGVTSTPTPPAAWLEYACAGARAAWRCRGRSTLQHTAVPLLLCLDKATHAGRRVRGNIRV
jgi:hypothetical protein